MRMTGIHSKDLQLSCEPQTLIARGGHSHFWQRAVSRRGLLGGAAGAAFMGMGLRATPFNGATPRPIPGGFVGPDGTFLHIQGGPGTDPSSITDFNGVVGIAIVDGTWSSGGPPQPAPLSFDTDMRFMDGEYIGMDGRHYQGSFALI